MIFESNSSHFHKNRKWHLGKCTLAWLLFLFFTFYHPFDFQKLFFHEKVAWSKHHSEKAINDFLSQQLSDYTPAWTCFLSISYKLLGYSWTIYKCTVLDSLFYVSLKWIYLRHSHFASILSRGYLLMVTHPSDFWPRYFLQNYSPQHTQH